MWRYINIVYYGIGFVMLELVDHNKWLIFTGDYNVTL